MTAETRPRSRVRRSGLTLVEMVVSVALVGMMLTVAINAVGASRLGQRVLDDRSRGHQLARTLAEEILQQAYADATQLDNLKTQILVNGTPVSYTLGPEISGLTNRSNYDDVDDYNGWSESPPQMKDGTAMSELSGWRRTVSVDFVRDDDPTALTLADEGAKRITVEVQRDNRLVARLVALRTLGPPPTQACCFPSGTGADMLVSRCTAAGGKPGGAGSHSLNTTCGNSLKPIAHWKFEESSGSSATDSSNSLVLTLTGGASWTSGQYGNALRFDGLDDCADMPHDGRLSLTSQVTVTAWIYKSSASGSDNIIVKGSSPSTQTNYHFRTNGDEISFGYANLTANYVTTSNANLTNNKWYHVAGTLDAATGTISIYKDGVLSRTGTVIGVVAANSAPLAVGHTALGDYFDGRIDDLRIYDKVLTVEQIVTVMNGGNP